MIGDEPDNAEQDTGTSDQAVSKGEERGGVTRCRRKAPASSLRNGCSVPWGWYDSRGRWACVRESTMKPVGKPDA